MNDSDKKLVQDIKEDLKLYFEFLELYKKPRLERLQVQIDNFVEKENSIMRRIRFIEDLEAKEKKKTEEEKKQEEAKISVSPSKNVKKSLKKISIINFILGGRKPVKDFGEKTSTLIVKFFGLSRSISQGARVEWSKIRSDMESVLLPTFRFIKENGWRYLNRLDYNVCIAFGKFVANFVTNSVPIREGKNIQEQIDGLEKSLPYYLQIITRPDYQQALLSSMKSTIPQMKNFPNMKTILPFITELLDKLPDKHNFINIVLSLYMLHYNQFISFDKLCSYFKLTDISDDKYHFDKKINQVVKKEVEKAKEKYNKANKDLFYIKPLDRDIDFYSDRKNDTVRLINRICVADRTMSTLDGVDKHTTSNPFKFIEKFLSGFIIRFIKGFIITYREFFMDAIYVKTAEKRVKAQIFDKLIFKKLFYNLGEVVENFDLLKQASESGINLDTYKNYLNGISPESDKEEKLCNYIKFALDIFNEIRDLLNEVMYNDFLAEGLYGEELLEAQKLKNMPILEIEENRPRFLPYSNDIITVNKYHEEKKVEEVVNEVLIIVSNLAYLFKDKKVISILNREGALLQRCEEALKFISKAI